MKQAFLLLTVFIAAALTSGCEGERSVFGEQKKAPDEFAVYSRAPLSLPPNFGLRPPRPGADRPQVVAPRNDARKALLGDGAAAAVVQEADDEKLSPGIKALLKQAGADKNEPEIRSLVNRETFMLSGGGDENFVDSILFWRKERALKGAVIDPGEEERRMRAKKSSGDAVVDQTPTIQRRGGGQSDRKDSGGKGFWGSLFD